jgi:hypothetical protein
MKCSVKALLLCFLIALTQSTFADIALLEKYSHKTLFILEQMVFKADCIVLAKKMNPFESKTTITFDKKDHCPPYNVQFFHFMVLDTLKSNGKIKIGQSIKVKEPFSDMAYTVHYSYYTKGFVIEPFIGAYNPEISLNNSDSMIIFLNSYTIENKSEMIYQFCILNAFESKAMQGEIVQILNRPPADMKRLFLKHKKKKS